MTSSDSEALFRIEKAESFDDGIKVLERLPLSHGYRVRDSSTEVILHDANLFDHFGRRKVSREPFLSRGAEGAGHGAAYLRREANGEMIRRRFFRTPSRVSFYSFCSLLGWGGDAYRLYEAAVGELYDVFASAVF